MFNRFRFNRICKRIKNIKIQGATNVAKAALKAYYLYPNDITKRILINLRPTEPMLAHVLELADKKSKQEILSHFSEAQDKLNKNVFKLIKNNSIVYTHCHSTNVIKALIYSKNHGKTFEVYNTETRPLFQGRKTTRELSRAGIRTTQFVDSAIKIALVSSQKQGKIKKVNLVLLGADALLDDSVINKVGSGLIAEIAFNAHIPLYIVADSWKYASQIIKLEQRDFHEIWNPKENKIHIKNPAFEVIPKKYIKGIITEYGLLSYDRFLSKMKKR